MADASVWGAVCVPPGTVWMLQCLQNWMRLIDIACVAAQELGCSVWAAAKAVVAIDLGHGYSS